MPAITPAIARAFIDHVKLAPARRTGMLADTPPVELKTTDAQSLVVGCGLIAAAEKVPVQTRQDLVDCTLFAQLAATAAVADPDQVERWYHAYFRTLTALGWAQSDTQLQNYEFEGKNAQAHEAILGVLSVLLGPQAAALAIVKAAVEALQAMSENRPWLTLFERESKLGKTARFQVTTAQIDPDGLLQVALVGFGLQARSTITQVLFFKFASSSTRLTYAAGKATIYEAALESERAAIAARLAAYRAGYIGEVKLAAPPLKFLSAPRAARRRTTSTPPPEVPASTLPPPSVPGARVISPARLTRALLS